MCLPCEWFEHLRTTKCLCVQEMLSNGARLQVATRMQALSRAKASAAARAAAAAKAAKAGGGQGDELEVEPLAQLSMVAGVRGWRGPGQGLNMMRVRVWQANDWHTPCG